jgi:hypothetical protein
MVVRWILAGLTRETLPKDSLAVEDATPNSAQCHFRTYAIGNSMLRLEPDPSFLTEGSHRLGVFAIPEGSHNNRHGYCSFADVESKGKFASIDSLGLVY